MDFNCSRYCFHFLIHIFITFPNCALGSISLEILSVIASVVGLCKMCCLKNPLMVGILLQRFAFCLNIDCYLTPDVDHFVCWRKRNRWRCLMIRYCFLSL